MAKVKINGEYFEFDGTKKPMVEALALEAATGMRWGEYEENLAGGSAKAMAAFCWLVWRRAGRGVEFKDILSGEVPVDLHELMESLLAAWQEQQDTEDPTGGGAAKDGSPATVPVTSSSSPKSSASGPGRSKNSTSKTSKP